METASGSSHTSEGDVLGSRRFYILFPDGSQRLDVSAVFDALADGGLRFDSHMFIHTMDAAGVPVGSFEESYSIHKVLDLNNRVSRDQSTLAEVFANDEKIALTIGYGSAHQPDLLFICVSRKVWARLDVADQKAYHMMLMNLAAKSGASGVLVIDDPADDFYDHLEPVDDHWLIDFNLPSGDTYDGCTIWVPGDQGVERFVGLRSPEPTGRVVVGLREYRERIQLERD